MRDGEHNPDKHEFAEVVADVPVEEQRQEAVTQVGLGGAQEEANARVQHAVFHHHQIRYLLCPMPQFHLLLFYGLGASGDLYLTRCDLPRFGACESVINIGSSSPIIYASKSLNTYSKA